MYVLLRIGVLISLILLMEKESYAQTITLKCKNTRLEDIIEKISNQTNISFITCRSFNENKRRLSLDIKNKPLTEFLDLLLSDQPYEYMLIDNICSIRNKEDLQLPPIPLLEGKVVDQQGEPIEGVSVFIHPFSGCSTDRLGKFTIRDLLPGTVLYFSCMGYEPFELKIKNYSNKLVELKVLKSNLSPVSVVNTGYQILTKKGVAGSVFRVNTNELRRVAVSNVLASLEGNVPGLLITQLSGLPGSGYGVQIRGQSTIGIVPGMPAPNDPLFVIDGIPFAARLISNRSRAQTGRFRERPFAHGISGDSRSESSVSSLSLSSGLCVLRGVDGGGRKRIPWCGHQPGCGAVGPLCRRR
jgi:hypothetical protein